ncbi:MAG: 3-deoxy-D-manno-octulosonic acid transferase [Flammeovirgaceae bacterium]|nr:3-deoxy-D-manno-octulosonic acid transferase [Flammeovirgaceae bacterium]
MAPFNHKAALFTEGRKYSFWRTIPRRDPQVMRYWFHVSSLGEFEQCRSVIESLKSRTPDAEIVLTFFSPSGFEVRKNYQLANWVGYIPQDQYHLAAEFLNQVAPTVAIFVKYEFWLNHLQVCFDLEIPVVYFSVMFRADHIYFGKGKKLYQKYFQRVDHFFVQDQQSADLIHSMNIKEVTIAGDTRFDRVIAIAEQAQSFPDIERFVADHEVWVMGSIWASDLKILAPFIIKRAGQAKFILAPHDIGNETVSRLMELFPRALKFSEMSSENHFKEYDILILDNMGMLSSIYRYAHYAYIGGAFEAGLHNTLEAAVFGMPIFIGRSEKNLKFKEVPELMQCGAVFDFDDLNNFESIFQKINDDELLYEQAAKAAYGYTRTMHGATEKITKYLTKFD